VCCFPESVDNIQLEITRLPVTHPKFLYRPLVYMGVQRVWKVILHDQDEVHFKSQ
jgi:hypothetical protein